MLYPLLTVLCGIPIVILAFISLARNLKANGPIANELRFLIFGLVLIGHFPLTHGLEDVIASQLNTTGTTAVGAGFALWASIVTVIAFQLAILPTAREIYSEFLFGRLGTRTPDRF